MASASGVTTSRARLREHRTAGFTLVEIGIVVALLGFIAVLVADFYANQLSLRHSMQRVEGTVRDARSIIDASVAWAAVNGDEWPNDRAIPQPAISLEKLVEEGYLIHVPGIRYEGCEGGCRGFAITGWDRAAARTSVPATPCMGPPDHTQSTASGNYEANPAADDLVLCFDVRGSGDAVAIASRLPQGRLFQTASQVGTDSYQVEARILGIPPVAGTGAGGSGQFVHRIDEGRPVIFADRGGILQKVRRISSIELPLLLPFEDSLPPEGSGIRFLSDGSSVDPAEDAITAGLVIDGRLFMGGGDETDIYFSRRDPVNARFPLRGLSRRVCRLEAANDLRPIPGTGGGQIGLDGSCDRLNRL
ncbi:MAG: type II secretion system protein [Gammaproteobacteria bacterium]|nr:type II secretion system protein [Gammaproteobacteria bacterium]